MPEAKDEATGETTGEMTGETTVDKRAIMRALSKMAFAAELLDEKSINAKGVGAAAWTIRSIEEDLGSLVQSGALDARRDLVAAAKEGIKSLVTTGTWPKLEELSAQLPVGLFDVQRIKGLGPKKVRVLWKELGISSLAELEYACSENRLLDLKGFGKKTQAKVLLGIEEVRSYLGRWRLDQMGEIADSLLALVHSASQKAVVVGDLRRAVETVDRLEILVRADLADLRSDLQPLEQVEAWSEKDDAVSFRFQGADVQLTLAASEETWGLELVLHTGSEAHLLALKACAQEQGFVLDDVSLRRQGSIQKQESLQEQGEVVHCPSEDDLYAALGLRTTAPERREHGVPLVKIGTSRPALIKRNDLRGALHNHTTASDGIHTLLQMRDGATAIGLQYLGITEHSQTASYAGGLDVDEVADQIRAVASLNAKAEPGACQVLSGIESDILAGGELDYENDVLLALDVVVASVHTRHSQTRAAMTERMVAAARHPASDIIGHPTGRMLLGRAASDFSMEALLDACAETGTAIEHNAQPARLDLKDEHLALAKERGVLISIAADAHSVEALSYLDFGVAVARRAGLTAEDVLNTRTQAELMQWLKARRERPVG